jgi:acetyl-CoA carboxylase biotin carboxylase subunit
VFEGYTVPPYYDSLVGKLIVHAPNREEAVALMSRALDDFEVLGVDTTIPFHQQVVGHPDFAAGKVTTKWVEDVFMPARDAQQDPTESAD